MLHRCYDWLIATAHGPYAVPAMIVVTLAEGSVSPIPPSVLLVPLMLARPANAWMLALCATLASVTGGIVGYAIGYAGFDWVGRPLLEFYGVMHHYDALRAGFDRWGVWIIILKGLTPVPYKLVAIASGVAHFDLGLFIVASLVQRSSRFFLMAALFWGLGDQMRRFVEKRLGLVFYAAVFLGAGGLLVLYLL